jgi:hypothetical protein
VSPNDLPAIVLPRRVRRELGSSCQEYADGTSKVGGVACMPEADLDFGIVDQLLRPAGEAVLTAETGVPTSSFAVGARLLEVVGEQLVTGQWFPSG